MKQLAVIVLLAWVVLPAPALAVNDPGAALVGEVIPADILTDGFLEAHPDLKYRKAGMYADDRNDPVSARRQYELAARYGDKPSQARLGEMAWNGQGAPPDRALGYLWMALAAERGYEMFATLKAYYWQQLNPREREDAVARASGMLQRYGDAVAKPRQAAVMRRESHRATGSMLGPSFASALYIVLPRGGSIDANRFYAREFWDTNQYWKLQDRIWGGERGVRIVVGDLQTVPAAEPKDAQPKDRP